MQEKKRHDREGIEQVCARVAFQFMRLDARRNPAPYKQHAPSAILSLAMSLRRDVPAWLYWSLVSMSKHVQMGMGPVYWRDNLSARERIRAINKARVPRR